MLSVFTSDFPECHFTNTAKKINKTQQTETTQQINSPTTDNQHANHYRDPH
jgi:hypothetical protein